MTEHKRHFAICVDNADYEASLILRKIYTIVLCELVDVLCSFLSLSGQKVYLSLRFSTLDVGETLRDLPALLQLFQL